MPSGLIGDGGSRGPVLQVRQEIRPVFGVQAAVGVAGAWEVPGKEGTERGSPRLGEGGTLLAHTELSGQAYQGFRAAVESVVNTSLDSP